ncbi:hypothetical protein PHYPSEUDO_010601 [Phytophthora pseudosyringae]|uniref:Uncharacterized protein n=1 Tax=Phytophthora pseudosyringae TaxID=221518 RepID=A0A8T1VAT3_9STRA|nr:hypothetical protein PHYPSEUDO_010601 [Phytophthora pseudosyringae]
MRDFAAPTQHGTLRSATCPEGDQRPRTPAAMNQLETPALEYLPATAAESADSVAAPPPAPSSVPAKGVKRHDRPEVDHEVDEQCQQEHSSSDRAGPDGDRSGNQRGLTDDACEPMVSYDGFKSVGKPFGVAALPRFGLVADDDEDVVNVRSPVMCKPTSSNARSATLSPTCVSALARNEVVKRDVLLEPSWSIQEFQEYLGMLELLQDVCSNSEGEEMCLSADSLSQMERLLTSLLPQGV